jgi:hypothetical protein
MNSNFEFLSGRPILVILALVQPEAIFNNISLPLGVKFFPRVIIHPFVHPKGWTLSDV